METVHLHPFTYDFGEAPAFTSFMTQRDAKYKKTAETEYNNGQVDNEGIEWDAFRNNLVPPTPEIKEIDGYEAEEE